MKVTVRQARYQELRRAHDVATLTIFRAAFSKSRAFSRPRQMNRLKRRKKPLKSSLTSRSANCKDNCKKTFERPRAKFVTSRTKRCRMTLFSRRQTIREESKLALMSFRRTLMKRATLLQSSSVHFQDKRHQATGPILLITIVTAIKTCRSTYSLVRTRSLHTSSCQSQRSSLQNWSLQRRKSKRSNSLLKKNTSARCPSLPQGLRNWSRYSRYLRKRALLSYRKSNMTLMLSMADMACSRTCCSTHPAIR